MPLPYTAVYRQDGNWIMGQLLEVPGVLTQGQTVDECRGNLKDALAEFLRARQQLLDDGRHAEVLREPLMLEPAQ